MFNRGIGTRVAVGAGIIILLQIITAFVATFNVSGVLSSYQTLVNHDEPVISNAAALGNILNDQSSALRSYATIGDASYLQTYQQDQNQFNALVATEKALIGGDPTQLALLNQTVTAQQTWTKLDGDAEIAARQAVAAAAERNKP